MYSQRYGALPLVRRAGGLADTVIDSTAESIADGTATGIVFDEASPTALLDAIERALVLYRQRTLWQKVQKNGMSKDFSWETSGKSYIDLYDQALQDAAKVTTTATGN
jgi:starch synthase